MPNIGMKKNLELKDDEPVPVQVAQEKEKGKFHDDPNTSDSDDQDTASAYPYEDSSSDDDSYVNPTCEGPECVDDPHFDRFRTCLAPSFASSDLHTIEEEWGSPPSENSISDDYTSSFNSEEESLTNDEESERYALHDQEDYESFEMVLQDEALAHPVTYQLRDSITHGKRAEEVEQEVKRSKATRNRFAATQQDVDASIKDDVFCMPCNDEGIEATPKAAKTQSSQSILQRLFWRKTKNQKNEEKQVHVSNPRGPIVPRKKTSNDEWKAAVQYGTGRIYYYHSKTRETTWVRPESFVLWKMYMDNGRPYFFNQVTKETVWEIPSDFDPWKSYVDPNSGNTYYYNVLTRETTWSKTEAVPMKEFTTSRNEELDNEELTATIDTSPSLSADFETKENEKKYVVATELPSVSPPSKNADSKKLRRESKTPSPAVTSKSLNRSYSTESQSDGDRDTTRDKGEWDSNKLSGKGNEDESKDKVRLTHLLSTYVPANAEINAAVINYFQGNEKCAISHIETIIVDTPFDEVHTAIYNYACSVLNQKKNRFNTEQKEPNYSGKILNSPILNTTNTRVESTERIRNVSRSRLKTPAKNENRERFDSNCESSSGSWDDNHELATHVLWPGTFTTPNRERQKDGLNHITAQRSM